MNYSGKILDGNFPEPYSKEELQEKLKELLAGSLEKKCFTGETEEMIISILLVVFSSLTSDPIIWTKNMVKMKRGIVKTGKILVNKVSLVSSAASFDSSIITRSTVAWL